MSRLPILELETGWRSRLAFAGPFKAEPLAEPATPMFPGRCPTPTGRSQCYERKDRLCASFGRQWRVLTLNWRLRP